MTATSCISHPAKNAYIKLYEWQVRFCHGNHCAALLLSYFSAWHDWKLRNDQYYRRSNDIAEMHGDGRPNNENAYLFFTTEELIDGCMGLYGKKAVCDGIDLLVSLGVISVHKNPNPRYHFDKTKYFQFYPHVCNRWIATNYPIDDKISREDIDFTDTPKMSDREGKKELRSGENSQPSGKTSQAITDTTNNTTNKNTNNYLRESCLPDDRQNRKEVDPINASVNAVIESLVSHGMPRGKLSSADDQQMVLNLLAQGADISMFVDAYHSAHRVTSAKGKTFNLRYLAKVVHGELTGSEEAPSESKMKSKYEPVYENYYSKAALEWMGDLVPNAAMTGEGNAGSER